MFKFALKNLLIKKLNAIFIIVAIMLSAGTALLAYNTAEQVNDGIKKNQRFCSAVIGPAGSSTQLVMNSVYFAEKPLGTIPYSIVEELNADERVTKVIPFAMADSYGKYSCVGTSPEYLAGKSLAKGEMFTAGGCFEVVLGSNAAKAAAVEGKGIGDVIYTSHSATGGETHAQGLTIVGILEETHSSFDNVVFTQVKTLWEVHEHGEEEEEEHHGEEEAEIHNMVCAILINTKNPTVGAKVIDEYNEKVVSYTTDEGETKSATLQAVEPMNAIRGVLEDNDATKEIVIILCGIILVMSILIIFIITLLNLNYSKEEIKLMRLIGIRMKKISLLYTIENAIIGVAATGFSLLLSKLCSGLMSSYVENMGIVLDKWKVYPLEFAILGGIFLITVLPTFICTTAIGKKDAV